MASASNEACTEDFMAIASRQAARITDDANMSRRNLSGAGRGTSIAHDLTCSPIYIFYSATYVHVGPCGSMWVSILTGTRSITQNQLLCPSN